MSISLEEFAARLSVSGLLTAEQVHALQAKSTSAKPGASAREFAWELVHSRRITEFQAKALYNGTLKRLVFGDYAILEKIGSGGMGEVYKAVHRRMDRAVAIKILPEAARESPEVVERFHREVKAAAKFEHPNIVHAYDAGEEAGILYLVMEFVDGPDLRSFVREYGKLPVTKAVNYIWQAAKGLQHAHSQGVIHRDIKPANLLLDKRGTVKILDMGLARLVDSETGGAVEIRLTLPGQMLGTVEYVSPEQAEDTRHADARSDLYSLGGTLHYLLLGRPPFPRETIIEVIHAHNSAPIPDLRAERQEVPDELQEIFNKLLAKRADDRFQKVDELIFALELCGVGEPVRVGLAGTILTKTKGGVRDDTSHGQPVAEDSRFSATLNPAPPPAEPPFSKKETVGAKGVVQETSPSSSGSKFNLTVNSRPKSGSSVFSLSGSDRQLAEWAMQVRGKVVVRSGEQRVKSGDSSKLPAGDIKVETLSLEYNKMVSDDDLARLEGLTDISRVYLHGTRITDDGLRYLRNARSLVYLSLGKTKVTDVGLTHLTNLQQLKYLGLYSTAVTDLSVQHISRLASLEELVLEGTNISDQGLSELQAALPKCKITR